MNRIEWVFELLDRASAPARRIAGSLDGVGRAARITSAASHKAHRALQSDTLTSARLTLQVSRGLDGVGRAARTMSATSRKAHRALQLDALTSAKLSLAYYNVIEAGAARSTAAVQRLGGSMAALRNLIVGGLLAGGVGLAAKSIVDQVGYVEQQRIAMGTLLRSPLRGEAAIEWAAKFADITPFDAPDVLQATRLALAMGFATTEIERLLTTLGDTAAGTGSRIDDLVRIFGQMRAAGRLATEDINQLAERGIAAWDYLARGLGTSTANIRNLVEQGAIDSATGIRLLIKGVQRDYGGLMDVQSRSIFGLMSTLRSRPMTIALLLDKERALEPFRQLLSNLVALSDFSRPPGSKIAKQLVRGISIAFGAAFGPLARATEPEAGLASISGVANGIAEIAARVRGAWPTIRAAVDGFWAGAKAGFGVLTSALQIVRPVTAALGRLTGALTGARTEAGNISGFTRLLGILTALSLAWRVLNIVSLGGVGTLSMLLTALALARVLPKGLGILPRVSTALGLVQVLSIVSPGGLGILSRILTVLSLAKLVSLAGRAIRWLGVLGAAALATARRVVVAGTRMAVAWIIGMGPIGWAIAGIGAVGAALGVLYARFARVREAVNTVWGGLVSGAALGWGSIVALSNGAKSAWGSIVALFAELPGRVAQAANAAWTGLVSAANTAGASILRAWTGLVSAANTVWVRFVDGAKSAWSSIVALFMALPGRIVQAVTSAGAAFGDALRNIIASAPGGEMLIKGLNATGAAVRGAAQFGANVGGAIVGAAKSALGVRSPSREFAYLGRMSALGLAAGLMAYAPIAERASGAVAQATIPQYTQPAPYVLPQARGASRSIIISLGDINVHAGSEASQIADAVRDAALEAVLSALERAAMEDGA